MTTASNAIDPLLIFPGRSYMLTTLQLCELSWLQERCVIQQLLSGEILVPVDEPQRKEVTA